VIRPTNQPSHPRLPPGQGTRPVTPHEDNLPTFNCPPEQGLEQWDRLAEVSLPVRREQARARGFPEQEPVPEEPAIPAGVRAQALEQQAQGWERQEREELPVPVWGQALAFPVPVLLAQGPGQALQERGSA
jgi:hypothetical protein